MHSAIIVSDKTSLHELNRLLADEGWWVSQIAAAGNGSWLVILTDVDPDEMSVEDAELFEDTQYQS
ncbi:MAG: hypothetical protein WBE18_04935 [Gammaproteobacteria bacterium]